MQRWGSHTAIWNDTPSKRPFDKLRQDLKVDTVVVGAGITGMISAFLLAHSGKKVVVITDGEVGGTTTRNSTGHLTQILDWEFKQLISDFGQAATQKVVGSCGESISLIENFVSENSINCDFKRIPGFKFTETSKDLESLFEEGRLASGLGITSQHTADHGLPFAIAGAVRFENQGFLNPSNFVLGILKSFLEDSGVVFEKTRALKIEDGSPSVVHTEFGSVTANEVILATHTPIGAHLSLQTRVAPYFSYVMAIKLRNSPKISGLFWDTANPYNYLRPYNAEENIWIVGGRDHKTGQEFSTTEKYLELEEYIQNRLDVTEVTHYWGDEIYQAADGLPYIGRVPFSKSLFTGTGYSGTGLTFGTLAGKIISDTILGKENPYASVYDPSRLKPMASASHFFKENLNVAKCYINDSFPAYDIQDIHSIAPNEGKIINYDGKKVAVYKNEKGRVLAFDSTCNHMGCTVHWNTAEKTWDCPCHGGRFRATGEVFEGPPLEDLEEVPLYRDAKIEEPPVPNTITELGSGTLATP